MIGLLAGCCFEVPILPSAGLTGGPDAETEPGDAGVLDAGRCLIDGSLVPAGTWLGDQFVGSCVICNPSLNPDGWTALDGGETCEGFTSVQWRGFPTMPYSGLCQFWEGEVACLAATPGSTCDGQFRDLKTGCVGGFCGDAGWCEVDQNLGWAASCGDSIPANTCAQGPCCMDAGFEGFVDGGGWCCGLIDGGTETCLPSGGVCYQTSDCCAGLSCSGDNAIYSSDAGYGFCEPI